jgi:PAS domain S-box-containing protein
MESDPFEILLVTDDAQQAALVRHALAAASAEFQLVTCETLAAANEFLATHRPLVALVAATLPAAGPGVDLLATVGDPPRFPVILLAAPGNERSALNGVKAGAWDYLVATPAALADLPHLLRETICQWQFKTQREASQRERAETEACIRQLAEHIRDVFWLYDFSAEKLLYVSPAFEAIWGLPVAWLYEHAQQWRETVHEDDRSRVMQMESPRTPGKSFDETYRIVRPAGEVRWIHDRRFAVCDAQGNCFRLAGIAEDITERQQASERQQQQATQLAHVARLSTLGELVAGIAHEVNQPLYAIANYAAASADALKQDAPPLAQLRQWNDDILKSAERAGDIIKRVRQYVSKSAPQRSPINLNTLVEESADLVAFEARRQRVAVQLDLVRPTPAVTADPVAIQQVLVNLLRNAFEAHDHTPQPDRRVLVRTTIDGGQMVVSVCDRGIGVSEAEMEQLFTPFFTSKPEGMGMGLPISKTIIEAHSGHIWATRNDDRGMTFHFSLPIAA